MSLSVVRLLALIGKQSMVFVRTEGELKESGDMGKKVEKNGE
jgi:hypothetical protein